MKLFHHCPEGSPAYPGINYDWNAGSKPRLRIVLPWGERRFELYLRFRPAYQPGMKRELFIRGTSWYENA